MASGPQIKILLEDGDRAPVWVASQPVNVPYYGNTVEAAGKAFAWSSAAWRKSRSKSRVGCRTRPMVFDLDDQSPEHDALPWLYRLKEINPAFKATLFAVPGLGSDEFWDAHPDWVELAVHGHLHPSPYECADWSYARMEEAILSKPARFVEGWKSPGWQSSDELFECLEDHGWWVACQHLEDARRPGGLRVYFYEDGHWHGHSHNVCGNGIEETWEQVVALVRDTPSFAWASEAACLCADSLRP